MKIGQMIITMTGIVTRTDTVSTGLQDDAQISFFFFFPFNSEGQFCCCDLEMMLDPPATNVAVPSPGFIPFHAGTILSPFTKHSSLHPFPIETPARTLSEDGAYALRRPSCFSRGNGLHWKISHFTRPPLIPSPPPRVFFLVLVAVCSFKEVIYIKWI